MNGYDKGPKQKDKGIVDYLADVPHYEQVRQSVHHNSLRKHALSG